MINRALRFVGRMILLARGVRRRALRLALRSLFRSCGKRVSFDPDGVYSFRTISIGNDVYIGPGATFCSAETPITISDKVMFGPNVTIMGGDHNIGRVGEYMADVKKKEPGDDLPIVIESDVWVGAGATILKGVTIGRGAVVGAGALVIKDVPPYSIVVGVPARVCRTRWPLETIVEHEQRLYGVAARLSFAQLAASCDAA